MNQKSNRNIRNPIEIKKKSNRNARNHIEIKYNSNRIHEIIQKSNRIQQEIHKIKYKLLKSNGNQL